MNALSYCIFMCDVTFLDNQRQDNWVWWLGYRQENQGIVVQISGGQQVCLFSRASRLAVQATYPPIQCRQRALSPVVKAASENSAEIENKWRNTSTPICIYGVHRHNSYFQKSTSCTCRMHEKIHKLFQVHRTKRKKGTNVRICSLKWASTSPGDTDLLYWYKGCW